MKCYVCALVCQATVLPSLPTDHSKTPWTVDERGILCIILNSPRLCSYTANLSAASHVLTHILTGQIGSPMLANNPVLTCFNKIEVKREDEIVSPLYPSEYFLRLCI